MSSCDAWSQGLGPEVRLLVHCARSYMDGTVPEIPPSMSGEVDWGAFHALARAHGVAPLVYWGLRSHRAVVPSAILADLQASYVQNVALSRTLLAKLLDVVALLEEAGVACVPFKGPSLALSVYGELADRAAGDLDIFVRRADARRAIGLLLDHDFVLREPATVKVRDEIFDTEYHCTLVSRDAVVEIHWDIAQPFLLSTRGKDAWWDRTEEVTIGGRTILRFSAEDQLLLLGIHGSKHLWDKLKWICDIGRLLYRTPTLAFQDVLERARDLGGERMVLLGIALARRLLDAPIPPDLERRIQGDRPLTRLVDLVRSTSLASPGAASEAMAPLFFLRLLSRNRDRLRLLRHLVGGKVAAWMGIAPMATSGPTAFPTEHP